MGNAKAIKKASKLLWIPVFVLTTIGIAVVIRRLLILGGVISSGSDPASGSPAFDLAFSMPPSIIMLHILPGLLFVILGPLQFMPGIRTRHIQIHRWSGRLFVLSAYLIGISAVVMPFIALPLGGISEAAGSLFFALFFLIALSKALKYIFRKQVALHREWMLRTYAIGLAIATVRPIMALSFVFFGMQPREFLGTAFWIGFSIHLIVAEIWINCTRNVKYSRIALKQETAKQQ